MSKTALKFCKSLSQVLIIRQAVVSSLLLTLASSIPTTVTAAPANNAPVRQLPPTPVKQTVAEQLLGQWQTKEPSSGQIVKFVFTPAGKLFFILPAPSGGLVALEMEYKINTATQPMQIDMKSSSDETAFTIFEITSDRKLRLELTDIKPNQPRPRIFSSKATVFDKVSEATTVPKDVQVLQIERKPQNARHNVAVQYINILNKAQQEYYKQKGKFAVNMEELGIITSSETESYRYQIVPQSNSAQSVMITAKAKNSQIPSYTGAVFASKINGKTATITGICESDRPSTIPPTIPKAPINNSSQIQCPAGSHLLK